MNETQALLTVGGYWDANDVVLRKEEAGEYSNLRYDDDDDDDEARSSRTGGFMEVGRILVALVGP